MRSFAAAAALGLALVPGSAGADEFADIARGIGKAAQRANVQKVQIIPFVSVDGQASSEGRMIASKIMSALIDQGKVLVVEGELPSSFPDPYRIAMGLKAKKGVRPEAEAVIMGTHTSGMKKLHLDVQLLRVQDRVILYSANRKVKNEWEANLVMSDLRPAPASLPVVKKEPAKAPVQASAGPMDLFGPDTVEEEQPREAPRRVDDDDVPCSDATFEVDRLQQSIMDIKARYVARKLRAAGRTLSQQPPQSLIDNPELQSQFEIAVQSYLSGGEIPALTKREIRTLLVVDGKSFEIHNRCKI